MNSTDGPTHTALQWASQNLPSQGDTLGLTAFCWYVLQSFCLWGYFFKPLNSALLKRDLVFNYSETIRPDRHLPFPLLALNEKRHRNADKRRTERELNENHGTDSIPRGREGRDEEGLGAAA